MNSKTFVLLSAAALLALSTGAEASLRGLQRELTSDETLFTQGGGLNYGANCWDKCDQKTGYCDTGFCGKADPAKGLVGGVCCRSGFGDNRLECFGRGGVLYHACSRPSDISLVAAKKKHDAATCSALDMSVQPRKGVVNCPRRTFFGGFIKDPCGEDKIQNPNPEWYVLHTDGRYGMGYYPDHDPLQQQVCGTSARGGATCASTCCQKQRAYCTFNCLVEGIPCIARCMSERGCASEPACYLGWRNTKPVDEATCVWSNAPKSA